MAARQGSVRRASGFVHSRLVGQVGQVAGGRLFAADKHREPSDPTRRSLLRQVASLAGGVLFVAAIYGYAWERLRFEIVRVEVPVFVLPRALEGLRVVQLSDIHVGDFMPLD
jgi:hypothetical protein